MTAKALSILHNGNAHAYDKAVAVLHADTREWWEEMLSCDPEDFDKEEEPATPDAGSLRRFIEGELLPW